MRPGLLPNQAKTAGLAYPRGKLARVDPGCSQKNGFVAARCRFLQTLLAQLSADARTRSPARRSEVERREALGRDVVGGLVGHGSAPVEVDNLDVVPVRVE